MVEEGDRQPVPVGIVDHAMRHRHEAAVGPLRQQVAEIDDEGAGDAGRRQPVGAARLELQPARVVLGQDGHEAVVGVGGGRELAVGRVRRPRRIADQPGQRDRPRPVEVLEIVVRQVQGGGERRQQAEAEIPHGREIGFDGRAEAREVGPDVGTVELAGGHVGIVERDVEAEIEALLEVGDALALGMADLLEREVAARELVDPDLHALFQRPGKEPLGLGEGAGDHLLGNAVADGVEEPDRVAGPRDLAADPLHPVRLAADHRPDIDDRNLVPLGRGHRSLLP